MASNVKPRDCPKFETCNAAICPLAPLWRSAVHLPGEKVCPYLLATGKQGSEERYADDPIFAACRERLPEVAAKHPDIATKVERAAKSRFKGDNLIGNRSV